MGTEKQRTEESNMSESQVLEFKLGNEKYCVNIDRVVEIVKVDELTPIPNSPPYVEGVMDLRGETAKIMNPKKIFDIDKTSKGDLVIVLDTVVSNGDENIDGERDEVGQRNNSGSVVGWLVDDVSQVVKISEEDVDKSVNQEGIVGIVRLEEEFLIWAKPEETV